MRASGMQPAEVYAALVRRSSLPFDTDPSLVRLYDKLSIYLRQADVQMSPLRIFAIFGVAAAAMWLVSLLVVGGNGISGLVVNSVLSLVASCLLSGLTAWLWLSRRKAKRLRALENQMPLALDIVNRALRAGHPVVSAVRLAAEEMGDPIGSEFGLIVDETTYGFAFKEALANFARRTGSADARFFAVSVSIQSETGGNLAEILEGLAKVMRDRSTLGKRVKALSSEGRASAKLLSALPVLLIAFFMLVEPTFYTTKYSDPIFWPTVSVIGILYLVGILMIRRIINIRY
jgi:tight adherence protein B